MENKSFEEKMKELQDIVEQINSGNLPLDKTMDLYNKGKQLIQELSEELNKYEEKITKVVN